MINYTADEIPNWCCMCYSDHFDGMGGCWGISHGLVKQQGEPYCSTCEFYDLNARKIIVEEIRVNT